MRYAEIIETHYTDIYPASFEQFRKKYSKLLRERQAYGLYVQFTNHVSNMMDRTAYPKPDHSDPVGVYGYPLEYVLKYPSDVWYGKAARYLRVLQDTSKHLLWIEEMNNPNAASRMLWRMGFHDPDSMLKLAATVFKVRNSGPNRVAKSFLTCVQMTMDRPPPNKPLRQMRDSDFQPRPGTEQSALFRKAGFDAIRDAATNNKKAIINDREPEQIIFLNRAAFRVVEVVALRPGIPDSRLRGLTHMDPSQIERKLVANLAAMMGDKIKDGPERTNLGGWSFYWTKKGRRIEIRFEHQPGYFDNKKMGEKKHRVDRVNDDYDADVVIHTELGDISASYDEKTKFKDIVADLQTDWVTLQQAPQQTKWQPQDRASYVAAVEAHRKADIRANLDKEKQQMLAELPRYLDDMQWFAQRYHLPFNPPDGEAALPILKFLDFFGNRRRQNPTETLDESWQGALQTYDFWYEGATTFDPAPARAAIEQLAPIYLRMYDDAKAISYDWQVDRGGKFIFTWTRQQFEKQTQNP